MGDRILVVCGQGEARHAVADAVAPLAVTLTEARGVDPFVVPFDLAILDGAALDRWWRRLVQRRSEEHPVFLPALVLTGRHGAALASKAYEGAVDDVTPTPFDPVELRIRITTLLRARNTSRELETRFRPLFDHVPAGLFRAVLRGDDLFVVDANPFVASLLDNGHLAMRRDHARALARRLRVSGVVRELRTDVRRTDGARIPVIVAARVAPDGRETFVDGAVHPVGDTHVPPAVELLAHARRRRGRVQPVSPGPPTA